MKLYEFAPTRSIRARWTLQELGIDFESVVVNLQQGEHRRPEFLRLNPAGKLPVLVDGEVVLNESVAIVLYLAGKYPERGLLPPMSDPSGSRPLAPVHGDGARAAALAHRAQHIPISRGTAAAGRRTDREARIQGNGRGRRVASAGTSVRRRRHVTVADFVLAYTLDWGHEVGLLGDFPALEAYVERMYARPRAAMRIADAMASIQ